MQIDFTKFEVDETEKSITFSCASDLPYTRFDELKKYAYDEVLVISEEAIDLTRLNGGASLLMNHNSDELLGCVDKAYIVENKLFVKVRFSRNDAKSIRIFQDILDGVVKNVSIGYQVQHFTEERVDGVPTRYVDAWMPYEVSVVSIPADETVGIRSLQLIENKEVINMKKNKKEAEIQAEMQEEKPEITNAPVEEVEKAVAEAVAEAQAEVDEDKLELAEDTAKLEALQAEIEELKAKMAELEKPCEEAQCEKACEKKEDAVDAEATNEETEIKACGEALGVPEEEVKKALESGMTSREFKRNFKNFNSNKETRKMENKFADYIRSGNFAEPFVVRDYTGFYDADLIGTQKLPLVKILEKKMGVQGFKTLSGLKQNISIPVQTTRNTIAKTDTLHDAATASNPQFTARTLTPKKFTGMTRISKDLLVQATDDIQAFIIDSLTNEIMYKIEAYLLSVVASNAGNTVEYSSLAAFDWDDALAFESKVGGYNLNNLHFVMSPAARAALKGISKDTGSGRFIIEDNQCNGYNVSVSGCTENDSMYFGAWDHLILGEFGEGLQILVDPYTYGAEGDIRIVGTLCADACIDNTEAFVLGRVPESSSSSSSSSSEE